MEKQEISQFKELIPRYQYFLLDAYGVFWESAEAGMLPQAKETMAYLVSHGKKVGILSNMTLLTFAEKLAKHGVQKTEHYHFLLTSGNVVHHLLMNEELPFATVKKRYWLFGTDHPRYSSHSALFQGTPYQQTHNLEEADFVYIPIPHIDGSDQESSEMFLKDIKEIARKGLPILCGNPDQFAHEGRPSRLVIRQGMIAQLFKDHGADVHCIGKPHPRVFEEAVKLFGEEVSPEQILMIGDTPETDIRGAKQVGMSTALVAHTGIMNERMKRNNDYSINSLPETDRPHYLIERFSIDGF